MQDVGHDAGDVPDFWRKGGKQWPRKLLTKKPFTKHAMDIRVVGAHYRVADATAWKQANHVRKYTHKRRKINALSLSPFFGLLTRIAWFQTSITGFREHG